MAAPIINPYLMYNSPRMAMLSDPARLHWPWLFLASNGYGRLELNHRSIVGRVYVNFAAPPSEPFFMNLLREYHSAWLLYTYAYDGLLWGQWEVSERYLPRYKTALDEASPAPPAAEYQAWQQAYANRSVRGTTAEEAPAFGPLSLVRNLIWR